MKKLNIILAFLLAALMLAAVPSAFGCTNKTPAEEKETYSPAELAFAAPDGSENAAVETEAAEHPDPPCVIILYNSKEIAEFLNSPALEDGEFERFMTEKGYRYNGVESKEDALGMIEILSGMFVPVSEKYGKLSIDLYPEGGFCYVNARSEEGGSFDLYYEFPQQEDAQTRLKSISDKYETEKIPEDRCKNVDEMYHVEADEAFDVFCAVKDGVFFCVRAWRFGSTEEAVDEFDFDLVKISPELFADIAKNSDKGE